MKKNNGAERRPRDLGEQGFALVVVIMVLLLASFLASQLILLVRTELTISHNIKARVIGHFLAESGVNLGVFRLFDRPLDIPALGVEEDWEEFFEGYEYEVFLPKGRVTYYVASESGKIDLNKAPRRLLELFLEEQLGAEQEEQIGIIIDSLLDWRDNDDLHRLNGAESETYGNLDDPYIARNGKIQDPAEFFLINGTEVLAGKFYAHEIFTVNNTGGKINFNSLSPAMLDFLAGGDKEKVAAYREAKMEFAGKLNVTLAVEILGNEQYEKFRPYLTFTAGKNKYYSVVGTGYAGVEPNGEDPNPADQEGTKKKVPGILSDLLIKKEGTRFTCVAWQERYI